MHAKAIQIVDIANALVGVPFRHQGRNTAGLDCAGLLVVVAHATGISEFDTTEYSNRPNVAAFTKAMVDSECTQLRYGQHEHGDILRLNTEGQPVHIAIYEIDSQGREWYIHAYLPLKKVVRTELTKVVKDTISSVWRFPE